MQIQNDSKPYDDINITPMLDLAYVLLVIFIIMTTATVQGQKVNLPKASAAPSLATQTTQSDHGRQRRQDLPRHHPGDAARARAAPGAAEGPDAHRFPVAGALCAVMREAQYQNGMDVLDLLGRIGLTRSWSRHQAAAEVNEQTSNT